MVGLRDAHGKLVPRTKLNNVHPMQRMTHPTTHAERAELNNKPSPSLVQTKLNRLTLPMPPLAKLNNVPTLGPLLHKTK